MGGLGLLVAVELGCSAVGVAVGSDCGRLRRGGLLMPMFAATLGSALMRGRAGAPCACFGARSTVSGAAIARNLVLAAAFAALPSIPGGDLSTDEWLGARPRPGARSPALALAVAVLALAREVGMLRLRLGPAAAPRDRARGPRGRRQHGR